MLLRSSGGTLNPTRSMEIPAAEEFPTRGCEAGLENGCIRTTVHGDERRIFREYANEDCTVKLRAAIKKALNPPLSFGGCRDEAAGDIGSAFWRQAAGYFGARYEFDLAISFATPISRVIDHGHCLNVCQAQS